MSAAVPHRASPDLEHLRSVFALQRDAFGRAQYPDAAARDRWLAALGRLLHENIDAIAAAIARDFGHRSHHETELLEIFPCLEAVAHARRNLRSWMKPERRRVSLWFQPGRAEVFAQPLGVVGIVVPWNYPIYLAVGPLVGALAAGNRAMVKMSELTPATGALFAALVAKHFRADEVCVINGDVALARAFAALPFDHLLFTGSTAVGRAVMRAAADNLTPVTLELGGKSPAILGPDYPAAAAAERILVGKCLNAGQTCIAPDYALVPEARVREFADAAARLVNECYPDPMRSPDYTAIVNDRHFARLAGYLDEARARGAQVRSLAPEAVPDPATRRFPPTLVTYAPDDCRLMREEIFGPILPVVAYRDLEDAIAYVNVRPRPLALYYFDRDEHRIARVLADTVAGGVTINDTILHIAQERLPFGGVGPSGMGEYHGRDGFDAFSKRKAVFRQARLNAIGLFNPPYGKRFERLMRLLLR